MIWYDPDGGLKTRETASSFSMHLFFLFSNWLFFVWKKTGVELVSSWRPVAGPNYIQHMYI